MLNTLVARATHTSAQMPRDTRDTLFVLAVILAVVLPQAGHLPWWCTALTVLVLGWRGYLALGARPLPSAPMRILVLVVAMLATLATHRTLLGRDAGVTLINVLLALKTLELRAKRDAFVVFFLGFFALLTNFFYSQSLLTAVSMLVGVLGLLTALVNAHMPVGKPSLMEAARTAAWMSLLGAPIMAVLFALFPRVAPLWGVPGDAMTGRTGLSGSMQVGNVAQLAQDQTVAMRIKFEGPVPPPQDLYFRGPVLSDYDGKVWKPRADSADGAAVAASNVQVSGAPVKYEITLEPSNQPWLPVLELTTAAPTLPDYGVHVTADWQWMANRPINELVRFKAESYLHNSRGTTAASPGLNNYLALPPGYNPRTLAWARLLLKDPRYRGADAQVMVQVVLDQLHNGGYLYTLDPGIYGSNTADEFWFDNKTGFCEHIASAFVIMMRALGIPARIVTGYQGGELNPSDGYWVVRDSDAHAWAEIWEDGRGWIRIDPTAVVAPSRIAGQLHFAGSRGLVANALDGLSPNLWNRLRSVWDATNNRWNQWILNYNQGRQLHLLRNLGFSAPSWEDLTTVLAGLLIVVSLVGAAWTRLDLGPHDPWLRLLAAMRKRLAAQGIAVHSASTPRQMAQALQQQGGAISSAQQWLMQMELARYAPNSGHNLAQLRRDFAKITWPS